MITIRHLKKEYPGVTPLKDVNVEISRGDVISVIGPSGTGKSTLIRCLNLLEQPTSGEIIIDGEVITDKSCDVSRVRRKMGMVFQQFNLFPHMTVIENIMTAPVDLLGKSRQDAYDKGMELLRKVGLADKALVYPDGLSGGQKQRVAIARTLVLKPRILLLDEPLSALDGLIKESIKERIRMIARQFELTTLIVTHDPEEALTLSDRVLIINNGRIAQFADPMTIINKPADDFVNDFIISQLMVKRTNILKLFSGPNPKNAATLKAESGALA